jgi:hypothetical protein
MKNLLFILCVFVICGCRFNSAKLIKTPSSGDSVWNVFSKAVINRDTAFLIKNSLDSIKCTDCIPDTDYNLISAKYIYTSRVKDLMSLKFLQSKTYIVEHVDSLLYINYIIKDRHAEENGYNMIFIFVKRNQAFIFKGMITTP